LLQPGEGLRGYRVTDGFGRRMYVVVSPNDPIAPSDQFGMDTISDSDGREQVILVTQDGTSILDLITAGIDLTTVVTPDELDAALLGYIPEPEIQQEGHLVLTRGGTTEWQVIPVQYTPDRVNLGDIGPTRTIVVDPGMPVTRRLKLDQNSVLTVNIGDMGILHLIVFQTGSKTLSIIDSKGGTANLIEDVPTAAGWFSMNLEGTDTAVIYEPVTLLALVNEPPPPPPPETSLLDVQFAATVPATLSNNVVFVRNDSTAIALSAVASTAVTSGTDVQAFNLGKNTAHLHRATSADYLTFQPGVKVTTIKHDAAPPTTLPPDSVVVVVDNSGGPTGKYYLGD
jgi:hypothetical protein